MTDKVYIGSTCEILSKRLYEHRKAYRLHKGGVPKYMTSYEILAFPDHYIELIENYPCEDRNILTRQEGLRIRECETAVNKMIPHRTSKEYRNDNAEILKVKDKAKYEKNKERLLAQSRERYVENKEHILEQAKQYYIDNKDKIAQNAKTYRETNKETLKESKKKYYEENKDTIAERTKLSYQNNKDKIAERAKGYREKRKDKLKVYNSQKHNCECGGIYTTHGKSQHLQTKKHIAYKATIDRYDNALGAGIQTPIMPVSIDV